MKWKPLWQRKPQPPKYSPPFRGAGADNSAPLVGEGVGVVGTTATRHPSSHTHLGKKANLRVVIGTTGVPVPGASALGHMCAKGVAKRTPCRPVQRNRLSNEGDTAMIVDDTCLSKVVSTNVYGTNRQVETE